MQCRDEIKINLRVGFTSHIPLRFERPKEQWFFERVNFHVCLALTAFARLLYRSTKRSSTMKPWERVVKAMQHAVPDRVPLYEMHIPPKVASVILGKDPSQVALHNPEVFFRLAAEKRVNLDRINKQVADELVSLYVKLGIDWIRVVGAYIYVPRGVKRLGEREWLVDGRLLVWSGETLWDPQMLWDAGGVLDADSLLRYCRSAKPEVNPKVFDVLREVAKRVKGELFLSFDADGTWGPIVSSPPL